MNDSLSAAFAGHYTVERKLGEGGMATDAPRRRQAPRKRSAVTDLQSMAVLACGIPAWRVARVDPVSTLRAA